MRRVFVLGIVFCFFSLGRAEETNKLIYKMPNGLQVIMQRVLYPSVGQVTTRQNIGARISTKPIAVSKVNQVTIHQPTGEVIVHRFSYPIIQFQTTEYPHHLDRDSYQDYLGGIDRHSGVFVKYVVDPGPFMFLETSDHAFWAINEQGEVLAVHVDQEKLKHASIFFWSKDRTRYAHYLTSFSLQFKGVAWGFIFLPVSDNKMFIHAVNERGEQKDFGYHDVDVKSPLRVGLRSSADGTPDVQVEAVGPMMQMQLVFKAQGRILPLEILRALAERTRRTNEDPKDTISELSQIIENGQFEESSQPGVFLVLHGDRQYRLRETDSGEFQLISNDPAPNCQRYMQQGGAS